MCETIPNNGKQHSKTKSALFFAQCGIPKLNWKHILRDGLHDNIQANYNRTQLRYILFYSNPEDINVEHKSSIQADTICMMMCFQNSQI